jgi:hypothetical protein
MMVVYLFGKKMQICLRIKYQNQSIFYFLTGIKIYSLLEEGISNYGDFKMEKLLEKSKDNVG